MPNARACPRCGLVLPPDLFPQEPPPSLPQIPSEHKYDDVIGYPADYPTATNGASRSPGAATQIPSGRTSGGPIIIRGGVTGPLTPQQNSGPLPRQNTGPLTPRGALELLPGESVAYQLGALYLTTKRVILLAPSVVRSAFVRDIDAVGTFTERSSGWLLALVLFLASVSGALFYASVAPEPFDVFPFLYIVPPWITAIPLALFALYFLARYFFWTKRTLFVSVKGRPLITVSISDWSQKRLDGMDEFVNSFFQIKDLMTGDLHPADQ
jgi:hypothetical protein